MAEPSIAAQVLALQGMTVAQLRERWQEVFGETTTQRHRIYMIKRIAWKLQEDRFGKLTPEQEARVAEYRKEIEAMPPEKWFPRSKANRAAAASAEKPRPGLRDRRAPPSRLGAHPPVEGQRRPRPGPGVGLRVRGPHVPVSVGGGPRGHRHVVERVGLLRLTRKDPR